MWRQKLILLCSVFFVVAQDDCGVGNGHVTTVYRGQEINKGDWPWLSAIFRKTGTGLDFTCAGSLVSKSHVITAAHCLYTTSKGFTQQLKARNLLLFFGKHHLFSGQDDNEVQVRSVSERFLHPQYNHSSSSKKHDIAILVLAVPVSFSQFIKPVCLWEAGTDPLQGSDTGTVVGWGSTNDQDSDTITLSEFPRAVRMPVVTNDICLQSLDYFRTSGIVTDRTICAGKRDGSGTCSGDSGGGLFVLREDRWVLRGVISKSLKNQNTGGCNLYQFAVMTDVYKYMPWLYRTIGFGQEITTPRAAVPKYPIIQGTELIGDLRYVFGHNEKLKWFAAREKCRAKLMDLFSPASLEEYETVLDYIIDKHGTGRDYWIGANDLAKEGNFVWASTGVSLSFSFWRPGEPTNSGGGMEEDCVCMVPRERRWNDDVCSEREHSYVCS